MANFYINFEMTDIHFIYDTMDIEHLLQIEFI